MPNVQARSHSMPNGRASGSFRSGSNGRLHTQSARQLDVEAADEDDGRFPLSPFSVSSLVCLVMFFDTPACLPACAFDTWTPSSVA